MNCNTNREDLEPPCLHKGFEKERKKARKLSSSFYRLFVFAWFKQCDCYCGGPEFVFVADDCCVEGACFLRNACKLRYGGDISVFTRSF
jgi:hypothetical protein